MVVDLFHQEKQDAIFDRTGSTYCLRTAWHALELETRESKSPTPAGDTEGQRSANEGQVSREHLRKQVTSEFNHRIKAGLIQIVVS